MRPISWQRFFLGHSFKLIDEYNPKGLDEKKSAVDGCLKKMTAALKEKIGRNPGVQSAMTMDEEKIEGVVLRSIEYKDRQRIVHVFTPGMGLISLIIKNISRRNTRLLSLSTPFCFAEFIFRKGRSDLFQFQDGAVLDEMLHLRKRLNHLKTAGALAQAILHSQMPGKPAPGLYLLFTSYMRQTAHFEDSNALLTSFYLKILKHEGQIILDSPCPVCSSPAAHYLQDGESFCAKHAPKGALVLSADEFGQIKRLKDTTSFTQLKEMKTGLELTEKIADYFKNQTAVYSAYTARDSSISDSRA